jgi:hypothetical protein
MTALTQFVASFADLNQRHNFDERAAIHFYDGKADLHLAERLAYKDVFGLDAPEEFLAGGVR